jgi:hypothetical protein
MDDIASVKVYSAKEEIHTLARKCGNVITRLAGDDIELDDTERLLLALERTGHLPVMDADRLHVSYMRQRIS